MLLGGLETIAHNINHRQHNLRLYEAGNVYSAAADTGSVTDKYAEERHLTLFITGLEQEKNWNNTAQPTNFFTLKNILERLLTQFNVDLATLQTTDIPADIFADGIAYKLMGQPFLEIGVAAPAICRYFDIKQEVYFAQMRWKVFTQYVDRQKVTYTELPKYPEVHRDLAILIDKQISFVQLHRIAFKTEKRLLKKLTLFDVYEGGKLPDDKKSYALSFVLQDSEKTLSDNEIDTAMKNLMSAFQRETGATLR
jgi:phenylalanyl-tRNA synthetase beta chain